MHPTPAKEKKPALKWYKGFFFFVFYLIRNSFMFWLLNWVKKKGNNSEIKVKILEIQVNAEKLHRTCSVSWAAEYIVGMQQMCFSAKASAVCFRKENVKTFCSWDGRCLRTKCSICSNCSRKNWGKALFQLRYFLNFENVLWLPIMY